VLGYGEPGKIAPSESRKKVSNQKANLKAVVLLQEYQTLATKALDGRVVMSRVPGEMMTYRLHANMDRPSEFSLGNFQIRIVPLAWNHSLNELSLAIHLDRHHGDYQQLVESIGDWNLTGRVQAMENQTFQWRSGAKHTFMDKVGNALLTLEFADPTSASSAAELARRRSAEMLK
jgi:hypothetical protein